MMKKVGVHIQMIFAQYLNRGNVLFLNKMLEYNKENGIIINKYIRKTIQKQIRIHNKVYLSL